MQHRRKGSTALRYTRLHPSISSTVFVFAVTSIATMITPMLAFIYHLPSFCPRAAAKL